MQHGFTRRSVLRQSATLVLIAGSGGLLAACGAASAPAAATVGTRSAAAATSTATTSTAAATTSATSRATAASTTAPATPSTTSAVASASATSAAVTAVGTPGGVQFYAYLDPTNVQAEQEKLLAGWRALHPNIPVEILLQPGATVDAITKLTVLVAGGTPPDVLMDLGTGRNLSQLQLVQPLDDLIGRDKYDLTQFNSKMLDYKSRFQGKTYMIPYETGGNAIGLFYNRQLFQQAGVAEPPDTWDQTWTWAQWVDHLTHLTKTGGDGKISQFGLGAYGYFIDYPIAYGGQWLSDDFTKIVCDSDATIQSYSDFADLMLKQHVTARPGEATALFGKGDPFLMQKVAIASIGPWDIPTYVGGKAPGVDWAFMPFPRAKIATPDISPVALALVQGAKHRDDGWTLLKWLVQDSNLANFLQRPPAAQSDLATWAAATFKDFPNSRWQVFVDSVSLAQPPDNILLHPKWAEMLKSVITPTFNQIWAGSKAVPTAMREMKPTLQQLVDQA